MLAAEPPEMLDAMFGVLDARARAQDKQRRADEAAAKRAKTRR